MAYWPFPHLRETRCLPFWYHPLLFWSHARKDLRAHWTDRLLRSSSESGWGLEFGLFEMSRLQISDANKPVFYCWSYEIAKKCNAFSLWYVSEFTKQSYLATSLAHLYKDIWLPVTTLTSNYDTVIPCWTKLQGHLMFMFVDSQVIFICEALIEIHSTCDIRELTYKIKRNRKYRDQMWLTPTWPHPGAVHRKGLSSLIFRNSVSPKNRIHWLKLRNTQKQSVHSLLRLLNKRHV